MINHQGHQPNPRVPTWVDVWARGLEVSLLIFDDPAIQNLIENGRANEVIARGKVLAHQLNHQSSIKVFNSIEHQMELLSVVMDYYSNKPTRSTRRYGNSDKDQIFQGDPNYYNRA